MGWTEVPDKASGDVFTEAMWDTYIRDNFNTGVPVKLAETDVTVAVSAINFTNINQDFRHLRLVCFLRGTRAATSVLACLRFNNDSVGPYDRQVVFTQNATTTGGETLGTTFIYAGAAPASTATAQVFGVLIMDLPNYSSTDKQKNVIVQYASKEGTASGNLQISATSGNWRNTAAITEVNLYPEFNNWEVGSLVSLYGMP